MVGNQYLYYDPGQGWIDGYFQFDNTSAPTQVTFSNNDFNGYPVFPISSTYTGTTVPPFVTIAWYSGFAGTFSIATRVAYAPTGTTATTTTHQVINFARSDAATFSPNDNFSMLFRYPENGPTGTRGPTGPTGAVGPNFGLASILNTGVAQSFNSGAALTTVNLGTVDIASTNTNDVTTSTANTITCVVSGTYLVNGAVTWLSPPPGVYKLAVVVGGTVVRQRDYGTETPTLGGVNPASSSATITCYVSATAGQGITLQVTQNSGSTISISDTSPTQAYLQVARVA